MILFENEIVYFFFVIVLILLQMSEPRSKIDMDKLLDDLLKAISSCYGCFGKTEEWSSMEVNKVKNELLKTSEKVDMNGNKT